MRALCYKCGHSWNYKGKITEDKKYLTCAGCYYKIRIDRALDFSTEEHQKLLTNQIKLPSLNNKIPTTHYSQPHKQSVQLPINIIDPIPRPYIEAPKEIDYEEEFEDQEELFTEIIIKLCSKHNLPARYDDYSLEWKCRECIELEIENNTIGKKYKDVTSHLGEVRRIGSDIEIYELEYPLPVKNSFGGRLIN